jgi:hypothetical protein
MPFLQNSTREETGLPVADQLRPDRASAVGKSVLSEQRMRPVDTLADAPPDKRAARASQAFLWLHGYLQQQHYRGYEFDDFLSSPLARLLSLNNLFLQRVAVQVGELLPLNVRPLLGIRKLESAKARGFFAKGYLYRFLSTGHESWLSTAVSCLDWLLENSSQQYPGVSWGNAFDFASRGGLIPKDRPTIVWTAHIAEAFDLAYDVTKKLEYLNALEQSARFIISALERHEDERGICFAYGPGAPTLVFNSNLLGAATLLRWWKHSGDSTCFDLAQRAIAWTLPQINPDGSWYYGAGARYRWIDNFHTAYNIDCLVAAHELGGESVVPEAVIEKSYQFWTTHFFLSDGTPKYYHARTYPLDIQCAAQAIETLSKLRGRFPTAGPLVDKVLVWTLGHMQKKNGAFRYQIWPFWKNNLEAIHWGQSTMLAALGAYLYSVPTLGHKS